MRIIVQLKYLDGIPLGRLRKEMGRIEKLAELPPLTHKKNKGNYQATMRVIYAGLNEIGYGFPYQIKDYAGNVLINTKNFSVGGIGELIELK